jgi:hypothetical protein
VVKASTGRWKKELAHAVIFPSFSSPQIDVVAGRMAGITDDTVMGVGYGVMKGKQEHIFPVPMRERS